MLPGPIGIFGGRSITIFSNKNTTLNYLCSVYTVFTHAPSLCKLLHSYAQDKHLKKDYDWKQLVINALMSANMVISVAAKLSYMHNDSWNLLHSCKDMKIFITFYLGLVSHFSIQDFMNGTLMFDNPVHAYVHQSPISCGTLITHILEITVRTLEGLIQGLSLLIISTRTSESSRILNIIQYSTSHY